jgi:hypothetical protein
MSIVLFVNVGRQHGIHDCVPHNWFGEVAEGCPFLTGASVATVVADRAGRPESIVTGRTIARQRRAARESQSFLGRRHRDRDSITLVKAQKLFESVGENAEEAGETDH